MFIALCLLFSIKEDGI